MPGRCGTRGGVTRTGVGRSADEQAHERPRTASMEVSEIRHIACSLGGVRRRHHQGAGTVGQRPQSIAFRASRLRLWRLWRSGSML